MDGMSSHYDLMSETTEASNFPLIVFLVFIILFIIGTIVKRKK